MQDFIDLYKNGYVPESATNDGFNETVANFKSGKTAMFIHHIGSSKGMVDELGDDVDAFIIPKGKVMRGGPRALLLIISKEKN